MAVLLDAAGLPQAPATTPATVRRKMSAQASRLPKASVRPISSLSSRTTSSVSTLYDESLDTVEALATPAPPSKPASISTGTRRTTGLQSRASPAGLAKAPLLSLKKRTSDVLPRDLPKPVIRRVPHSSSDARLTLLSKPSLRTSKSSTTPLSELQLPKASTLMGPPAVPASRTPARTTKQSAKPLLGVGSAPRVQLKQGLPKASSSRRVSEASWATAESTPSPPLRTSTSIDSFPKFLERVMRDEMSSLASPSPSFSDLRTPNTVRRVIQPQKSIELSDQLSPRRLSKRPSTPGLMDARQTRAMRKDLGSNHTPPSARQSRVHLIEQADRDREEAALRLELDALTAKLAKMQAVQTEGRVKRLLDVADGLANERNATKGDIEMLKWIGRDLEAWKAVLQASVAS